LIYGIKGVVQTTLRVAETHRAEKLVTKGVYSRVRHPQYFDGILAHFGFSFLLSVLSSLIVTPFVILVLYFVSWKEEKELIKEFGKGYENYKKITPMLLPKKLNAEKEALMTSET
jgi:protein-S-isoprenylcysteine O-methyltransferase Ste14